MISFSHVLSESPLWRRLPPVGVVVFEERAGQAAGCVNIIIDSGKSKSAGMKSLVIKRTATLKFSRFLADYYRKCCVFLIYEMLFSKF